MFLACTGNVGSEQPKLMEKLKIVRLKIFPPSDTQNQHAADDSMMRNRSRLTLREFIAKRLGRGSSPTTELKDRSIVNPFVYDTEDGSDGIEEGDDDDPDVQDENITFDLVVDKLIDL